MQRQEFNIEPHFPLEIHSGCRYDATSLKQQSMVFQPRSPKE
jgi:hypothetical protein